MPQVKDLVWSLREPGLLPWCRFTPRPGRGTPHAVPRPGRGGATKKKESRFGSDVGTMMTTRPVCP